jgi:hypothetical protein
VGWAPAPPADSRPVVRTTEVTIAGIILLVLGALGILLGGAIMLGGAVVGNAYRDLILDQPGVTPDIANAVGGMIAIVGLILLAWSLAYVAAGIGGLRGREWGRILGIVVAIIGVLFWLLGLAGGGDRSGIIFVLVLFACHAWVLFAYGARWRRAA